MKRKVCPRCGRGYVGYPALSRVDCETYVCSDCGVTEAFIDLYGLDSYPPAIRQQHKEFVEKIKLSSGKKVLKGRYRFLKES